MTQPSEGRGAGIWSRKFLSIFGHEYRRHVLRKRFLFALLSVPLWLAFGLAMAVLSVWLQTDSRPVGFIDPGGVLRYHAVPDFNSSPFTPEAFVPYPDEAAALAALEAEEIQAYFSLPASYPDDRSVRLRYIKTPGSNLEGQFRGLVRYNLLQDLPALQARRLMMGTQFVIDAPADNRKSSESEFLRIVTPIALGVLLVTAIFTSGGYLMQAVVEEKENRTMEILATSVSPAQIMNAKIAALITVGLTQVAAWALPPVGMLLLVRGLIPGLDSFSIDGSVVLLAAATGLPTFLLVAALMATLGATVAEAREGQQVIGMFSLVVMSPFFVIFALVSNPGGPVALALSFFPLTAALTLMIRAGTSSIPIWQIVLSAGILTACAVGALWLSGRAFRQGMLRYGQRATLRDALSLIHPRLGNIRIGRRKPAAGGAP